MRFRGEVEWKEELKFVVLLLSCAEILSEMPSLKDGQLPHFISTLCGSECVFHAVGSVKVLDSWSWCGENDKSTREQSLYREDSTLESQKIRNESLSWHR